ncbi:hypothetical protein FFF34_013315 [Inquilinus sp. KBS0705]|nr:hypothetical protein FFF34_013315 [Inquilinus sp. KBS0705]
MRKYFLLILIIISSVKLKAQDSYNYAAYGIGFGASYARPFADLKRNYDDRIYNVNLNYYYSPYLPITLEIQAGHLRGGGNTIAEDIATRRFNNNFKAVLLHANIQLGELIDYEGDFFMNVVKNFYLGSGFGFMINKVDANRYSVIDPTYRFPGKDNSFNMVIPIRFGYEFKIYNSYDEPNIRLDIGYQHNMTFGEGLDGYNDGAVSFKNNALDQYRQITIGIKFNFGGESSYDKSISGF